MKKFDFCGWATRNNLKCADGRIIMKDAFKRNDGQTVPLVWNHQHSDPLNVLGHALLENRDEGVYAYCVFNETEQGKAAKLIVEHGDVKSLSIFANQLRQQGANVIHGAIKELSLVLAGANPGAVIESIIRHGEECEDEAIIWTEEEISLFHSSDAPSKTDDKKDENEETIQDVFDAMTEKQKKVVYLMVGQALEEDEDVDEAFHSDTADDESGETVKDIFDAFTETQKTVVYALVGHALEEKEKSDTNNKNSNGGNETMKHNVFDKANPNEEDVLAHADIMAAINDGKRYGTLKESFLAHGIEDIEYLFPDARNVTDTPQFIKRDTGWVAKVMNGTHHSPFSRVKSLFADITGDEARARGYIKGNKKEEEVFGLLKRTTTPTTIYKKQKLDRDDIVDITDFDVIAWLKAEMRGMLDEEIARSILVGDGRLASSNDKVNEQNIRPIWTDDDLYTIKAPITVTAGATTDQKAKAFIRAAIRSRKNYKGSGEPTLYTTEDVITDCLLLEDTTGRVIYDSISKLATTLRVKEIVTVPVMEGLTRTVGANSYELAGIITNLKDYNVGADKGGSVNMFDDFDIDYNQQKYLIETRCSGAQIKPYASIALEFTTDTGTSG